MFILIHPTHENHRGEQRTGERVINSDHIAWLSPRESGGTNVRMADGAVFKITDEFTAVTAQLPISVV